MCIGLGSTTGEDLARWKQRLGLVIYELCVATPAALRALGEKLRRTPGDAREIWRRLLPLDQELKSALEEIKRRIQELRIESTNQFLLSLVERATASGSLVLTPRETERIALIKNACERRSPQIS